MVLLSLQIAAALTLPVDLGHRPGDVAGLAGGRVTLTGAAGGGTDVLFGGGLDFGLGLGLGLEATGAVAGATELTGGGAVEPIAPTLTPPPCGARGHLTAAVTADPAAAARREARVGLRWKIPTQSLAIRSDLFPSAGGGELRLEAWRRVGTKLVLTGFGGWRVRDEDGAVTWGAGAQLPISGPLHAVLGFDGAALTDDDDDNARLVAGVRLGVGPVDLLVIGGTEMISESAWLVGVGATFRFGAASPPEVPQSEHPRPEPARLLVIIPDEEAFGDPEPDDDSVGSDVVDDRAILVTRVADELILGEPVLFDRDRRRVKRAFKPALASLAAYLSDHPEIERLRIYGHADASGPEDWNELLSQRRADAVAAFLIARGVDAARLDPVGFGARDLASESPRDPRNRRVVFMIVK